jgi:Xaa-Pro aminopeptidase
MKIIKPGMYEYEISTEFFDFCTQFNIEKMAYSPIAGSGRDSAILHYIRKKLLQKINFKKMIKSFRMEI